MAIKKIDERLSRLQKFVDGWKREGGLSRIERDIVLEELRNLYNEVLDYTPEVDKAPVTEVVETLTLASESEDVETPAQDEEPETQAESAPAVPIQEVAPEVVAEPEVEHDVKPEVEEAAEVEAVVVHSIVATHESVGDAFDDALDIDALLGLSGEDSIEEAERAIEESREESARAAEHAESVAPKVELVEIAEAVAPVAEPVEEQPSVEKVTVGGLFDIDDIPVRSRRGRKMISLYDAPTKTPAATKVVEPIVETKVEVAEPASAPTMVAEPTSAPVVESKAVVEPVSAPAPVQQPVVSEVAPQRLGDVIAKNVTTLADKMAEEQPTAAFNRITDIRKAIGLNDKFLMIRDLFGGDVNLYEDTIAHLNEFDDLDECMIFIVENFRWNPDSEGAKLLVSLIERKLS